MGKRVSRKPVADAVDVAKSRCRRLLWNNGYLDAGAAESAAQKAGNGSGARGGFRFVDWRRTAHRVACRVGLGWIRNVTTKIIYQESRSREGQASIKRHDRLSQEVKFK